ncbi:hypothetical protein, partial [Enterobacter bugandensis]|uniref:hypothetical protein n=1 Tax=Enterobacter bugandensis TaxID=881260 RepID=UPI003F662982|nr:hypothetical protein [Enterobacter bugandensis]
MGFVAWQGRRVLVGAFVLSAFFVNGGDDAVKRGAELRQECLTGRGGGSKMQRRHRSVLLHSKLLASLTHQQE